jgi:glycogen synthase kinase 3 beta
MLNSSIPDYEPISLRGQGAFGYVIEAYDRVHDTRVAIKRTHKVGSKLSREYQVLSELKDCDYIVKLLDTFYSVNDDGKVIQNLVFEYVTRSLETYLEEQRKKKEFIPINKIKSIMKQMLKGLEYCHSKNIVHRDLKPENVLFTEDERVKICDFGSSKFIEKDTKSTPYIVSRYYRAPELLLGKCDYDDKIDIFAAGCIFAELFTLIPLFPGKTEGLQIFEHMCILGNPNKGYFEKFQLPDSFMNYFVNMDKIDKADIKNVINQNKFYNEDDVKEAGDLILKMIAWDSDERISAKNALKHPFFKN